MLFRMSLTGETPRQRAVLPVAFALAATTHPRLAACQIHGNSVSRCEHLTAPLCCPYSHSRLRHTEMHAVLLEVSSEILHLGSSVSAFESMCVGRLAALAFVLNLIKEAEQNMLLDLHTSAWLNLKKYPE